MFVPGGAEIYVWSFPHFRSRFEHFPAEGHHVKPPGNTTVHRHIAVGYQIHFERRNQLAGHRSFHLVA